MQKNKYILAINKDLTHTMVVVPIEKLGEAVEKMVEVDFLFIGNNKKGIDNIFKMFVSEEEDRLNSAYLEAKKSNE